MVSFFEGGNLGSVGASGCFRNVEGYEEFGGAGGLGGPEVLDTLMVFDLLEVLFRRLLEGGGTRPKIATFGGAARQTHLKLFL